VVANELREEMEAHFEMQLEDTRPPGVSEQEARAAARRHFGNLALIGDRTLDQWRFGFWDVLFQDLRYAARTLLRAPAFTIVALLSLGGGIGAGIAICSLMNSVLWRKLPVPNPERRVLVAAAAGFIPAHRASRIHPSEALRHD